MLTYPLRENAAPRAHVKGRSSFSQGDLHPDQSAAMSERHNNRAASADAMVVDWLRSGVDSLTLIEAMQQQHVRSPAMVLSALAAMPRSRVNGDGHPTKPVAIVELVAQIEALLRRLDQEPDTILRVGPVELDLLTRTAKRGDRRIELLPREFRLLEYMMRRRDQLVTRAMLFKEVWNYKFTPRTNLVDVHMGRLRRKLHQGAEQPMIYSIRGEGFVLRVPI
jgi:two-component system OmpR family response regulator